MSRVNSAAGALGQLGYPEPEPEREAGRVTLPGSSCSAQERRIVRVVEAAAADLVPVAAPFLRNRGAQRLLHRAADAAYRRMKAAAEADGIAAPLLTVVSGYRSVARQWELWRAGLRKHGTPEATRRWVAYPGHSPHHTGRAIDLFLGFPISSGHVARMRATPAYRWLVCNAARFGFTPYAREPWHWEYNPPGWSDPAPPGPPPPSPTPRPRPVPPPPAPPATGTRLLKRETDPPELTLYLGLPLGAERPGRPLTGVFVPAGYRPEPEVDLILYLHGHKKADPALTIDRYWNRRVFPHFALREALNATGRNAILVAPTLGPRSQSGSLVRPGGLETYLDLVLDALSRHGPHARAGARPRLRHLVLACHSGGGSPMLMLARGGGRYSANLRECWGFDSLYGDGRERLWAAWARSRPDARLFIHYGSGGTARRSERLRALNVPNVFVEGSVRLAHDLVPMRHWAARITAAPFLRPR